MTTCNPYHPLSGDLLRVPAIVAAKHARRARALRLTAEDVESVGHVGLVTAWLAFDPARSPGVEAWARAGAEERGRLVFAFLYQRVRWYVRNRLLYPRAKGASDRRWRKVLSLDRPVATGRGGLPETLLDRLPAPARRPECESDDELRRILSPVPVGDRELVVWCYCHGLSLREAALRLGVSAQRVQQRLARAADRLRRAGRWTA